MRQLRSDEARQDWRDLLDEVQRDPDAAIEILRYNKPVAVVVSADWYRATLDYIARTADQPEKPSK